MQRSITHQNFIEISLYSIFFIFYSSLVSIYPFLPPMLAVLFFLLSRTLESKDFTLLLFISLCLVVFEANNAYPLFSSIIYFYIVYKLIIPKIEQSISCKSCVRFLYVLIAYIGYFLFMSLIGKIFLLSSPELSYYIVYYIVIEFFLVSIL